MIMHMTHGSVSYYMYTPVPLTWQREVWNIGESKFGINFLDKKSILMYPNQYLSIIAKESSLLVI